MNSPTLALLRKDRPWLLAFAAIGAGLATMVFLENEFSGAFVVPERRLSDELEFLLAPLAALLGLLSAVGEDLSGTRDLLRHRLVAPARIFWTRQLACLAVIASWIGVGVAVLWLHELLSWRGGACADLSRFGALTATAAGFGLVHALVALAFTLPTRWLNRAWIAGLLVFARYAAQSWLGPTDPSWFVCLVVFLSATFAVLAAAAVCERTGSDADRPTPRAALVAAAIPVLAGASLFGAIGMAGWQDLALTGLTNLRPALGLAAPAAPALLGNPDENGHCAVLDADGRPTGLSVPWKDPYHVAPKPEDPDFDASGVPALFPPFAWYQNLPGARATRRVWIRGGEVRIVEEREHARSCWTLPLPERIASRGKVVLLDGTDDEGQMFVFAPEVSELLLVTDETPPRLLPRPLPDGDRPLRHAYLEVAPQDYRQGVVGEKRSWLHSVDRWEEVPDSEAASRATYTVLDDDPLRPEAELRVADGPYLRHRYELASISEKLFAGWGMLGAILRPPPFALLSARTDYAAVAKANPDEALLLLDPLLGGGYAWLLVPNLLLHVGLMALVLVDLRHRGASPRRTAGWMAATLVAGVLAGPVLLALEPKRAWRRPARSERPEMLVRVA